jgi:membrane-associated protease RseP (regulator of RpoE activity)
VPGWALYTIGVLVFAFGLLLSIALHEVGHMVPAKKFGVKVTQYMVGFGPTIWSRKRGDTDYGLKAVPAGGYIRMIGMVPPSAPGRPSRWPRRMARAIEDFRSTSRAEVDPQDANREFYRLTPGKKMIVMLGGPCMNLLIYLVLMVIVLMTIGVQHSDPTTQVSSTVRCVVAANAPEAKQNDCTGLEASPAVKAGLQPRDTIKAIDGRPVATWDAAVAIIEKSAGRKLTLTVDRAGALKNLSITPVVNTKCERVDGQTGTCTSFKRAGFIGVSEHDHVYFQTVGITGVPRQIGSQIHQGWDRLMQYPAKIKDLWQTVFDGKKRTLDGAVGVVGIGRISGDYASSGLIDTQTKIVALLTLLASVNLLLFFFNLIPLLPLDGGHVAGGLVEAIRRGWARVRGRGQVQIFVDTAQLLPVMYGVASLIFLVTLLTLYADIVKPVSLNGG